METVVRAVAIYFFLLILLRVAGKRALSEMNTFDLILALIISEAVSNAIQGEDHSLVNGFVAATTLIFLDVIMSLAKGRSKTLERWLDGLPVVIVHEGRPLRDRMRKLRVDDDDVLEAARLEQGIARMEEIALAVLERGGKISVLPRRAPHPA